LPHGPFDCLSIRLRANAKQGGHKDT